MTRDWKNHTLFSGSSPYCPYMGVPPPPRQNSLEGRKNEQRGVFPEHILLDCSTSLLCRCFSLLGIISSLPLHDSTSTFVTGILLFTLVRLDTYFKKRQGERRLHDRNELSVPFGMQNFTSCVALAGKWIPTVKPGSL